MVQGIKQLLNDNVGLGWRERFDAEQNARKNRLKANSPREGFKHSLSAREFADSGTTLTNCDGIVLRHHQG